MNVQDLIIEFQASEDEILGVFREGLTRKRGSYSLPHNASGDTSRNMEMTKGFTKGAFLTFSVNIESGFFLQKGGAAIYEDNAGAKRAEDEYKSPYIEAIIKWLGDKYRIYGEPAKRKAFAIANAAIKRKIPNQVVKHPGWVDDIRPNLIQKTNEILTRALTSTTKRSMNKLPKKGTTRL